MRLLIASLVSLFASAITSFAAPVLVFKGAGTQSGDSSQLSAGPVAVYLLVDLGTNEVATLTYGTRNKQKILVESSPEAFKKVTYFLANAKNRASLHDHQLIEIGQTYISRTRALNGDTAALKASSQANVVSLFPKILNGSEILFADAEPDRAADTRYLLRYQQARSIAVNDANQTISAAYNALITELKAKGFN